MSSKFPITRGFVIQSVLDCFENEGGDGHSACLSVGLPPPASLGPADILAGELYHALLDHMTEQLGDPFFAARAGRVLARQGVTALVEARRASRTIGEFLIRFQIMFKETQDSGWYVLECDGARATFEIRRWPGFKVDFAKTETLNAAGWITIFRDELGENSLHDLTAALPDLQAMPKDILPARQCIRSKDGRMKLSFPAAWLIATLKSEWAVDSNIVQAEKKELDSEFTVKPIRQLIANTMFRNTADLETVASRLGISKRKLQRMLNSQGTSFSKLLHEERLRYASELLSATQQSMHEIAEACGFSSSQALAKSFRTAFGMSPSGYRREQTDDEGSDGHRPGCNPRSC